MDTKQFERIKANIAQASASQVLDLEVYIHGFVSRQVAEFALARRTNTTIEIRAW